MKTSSAYRMMNRMINHKDLLPVLLVPSCILMIPLAAMLLEAEGWAWDVSDFVVAWVLIGGAMAAYKFVTGDARSRGYRVGAAIAVATALMLVWVNGAVGIIGGENNPANLLYWGVIGVGLVGAALARLRPAGMANAMWAMAAMQFLVPVIAVSVWRPEFNPGVVQVFALNLGFVALFAAAALLFRSAERKLDTAKLSETGRGGGSRKNNL